MSEKTIQIEGWISESYNKEDVKVVFKSDTNYKGETRKYDYFSLGDKLLEQLDEIETLVVDVSYGDWQKGDYAYINEVFVRYYIAKNKCTWDEVNKDHIQQIAGSARVSKHYEGYSEYTITDSYVKAIFGDHDLINEIKQYATQEIDIWNFDGDAPYLLLRIDIKTK